MNVLLVDDHRIVRVAITRMLNTALPSMSLAEADTGLTAVTLSAERRFDAVILDIGLPDISGLEVARRILQRRKGARILFLSMHDELPMVRQALDVGGLGFISKNCEPTTLVEAIQSVTAGKPYLEHAIATRMALNHPDAVDRRLRDMTQREMEVLVLFARGNGIDAIARRLCLSSKTVSNHLALVKGKLQVASSVQLIHLAADLGLVRYGERPLVASA